MVGRNKRDSSTRILVFPSCSEPGLEIVRALIDQPGLEVIGGSSLPAYRDPSFLFLKTHLSVPWLGSEGFQKSFAKILRDHLIQVVFPATDALIAQLSRTNIGDVKIIAPRPEVAEILLSKSKTYTRLKNAVPIPHIYEVDEAVDFPAYAKPTEEAGMRGHMQVNDAEELAIARQRGLLVTEFLPGEEFEVNCLSDLDGNLLYSNIRRFGRRLGGSILDSQRVEDATMTAYVESIASELRIEGPWFAQFKRNRDGMPVLMEANARIGGGSGLNRYCGVNIPLFAVKLFTGQTITKLRASGQVAVARCLQFLVNIEPIKLVVWDLSSFLRTDDKINPKVMACLFDLKNRGIRQHLLCRAGVEIRQFLKDRKVPDVFERIIEVQKGDLSGYLGSLRRLCQRPFRQNVFVTRTFDANRQAIQKELPEIRIVTPDVLELLGLERIF